MTLWSWTIPGIPVGKGRPRFSIRNGFAVAYTPERTRHWEAIAREVFACHWDGAPTDAAVSLEVVAVFPRPQRLKRAKDPLGRLPHTAKPDGDNCLKAVCDSLEKSGVVRNDSQVTKATVIKVYASKDEGPCVNVRMEMIDG
jgi:Holliday junction resolvase RusA-like endonuclease